MDPKYLELVVQGGALVILAFVLWYGMKFVLPTFHRQALKAIQENTAALRHQQKILARLTVAIITHDATVRGHDPETLVSTEELLRRVMETNGG